MVHRQYNGTLGIDKNRTVRDKGIELWIKGVLNVVGFTQDENN